ncbi:MAG: hypothetical protein CVV49_08290 [Spirochaetae bacterium HGW-Spirochaetae-5]|nr:MAG: hypothetical protein CVV49_08290 [Spirochaetae bacterium HGW-Spirochaetae-5]
MKIKKIITILFLVIIQFSCSREYIKPVSVKRNFSGALWVVRHSISTPQKIDKLLNTIKGTNIKHLIVQVRGRGDAYYTSSYEPAAFDVPEGFDPLEYIIDKTRKSDVKIHAWVNVSFVLNAEDYPPGEKHIVSKKPHWVTHDQTGRSISEYSKKELDDNLVEGLFLDPAIPEVKDYIVGIVDDILSRYSVDGIHLDYVRYPYSGYNSYKKKHLNDFGYNPIAREIFKKMHGTDPVDIDRFQDSREKRLFDNFRENQITEIVKRINKTVKSKNENIVFSAAVMPRHDWGKKVYFQDWPLWLDNNYIDLACVMSYSNGIPGFKNYIKYADDTRHNNRIFMGISVKKTTRLKNAAEQIDLAYENNMRGYSIFSFDHEKNFIRNLSKLIEYERAIHKY